MFYISFDDQVEAPVSFEDDPSFDPTTARDAKQIAQTSPIRDPKFRFRVLKRYGKSCAVCDIDIEGLLEAAHIVSVSAKGCDDPRNGLPLCRNHHRAYDKGLFWIDPTTFAIYCHKIWDRHALQITKPNIRHLPAFPAQEALEIVVPASNAST